MNFLSLRGRSKVAIGCFWFFVGSGLISAALAIWIIVATTGPFSPEGNVNQEANTPVILFEGIAAIELLVQLVAILSFCMWLYRAKKNLRILRISNVKYSPGGTIWSFFIPFVNLIVPFKAMQELYFKTGGASLPNKHFPKDSPLILTWWLCFIFSGLFSRGGDNYLPDILTATTLVKWNIGYGFYILSSILSAISAFLIIKIVNEIGAGLLELQNRAKISGVDGKIYVPKSPGSRTS